MKRPAALLIIILFLIPLSGCGSIYSNYREVEQMLVIQTMGLDTLPGGVKLSMASSADSKKSSSGPVRISSNGAGVTDAIQNARNNSHEEEIFYAHTKQMLIGEEAARASFEKLLAYICRSPDVSIDVPVFVVKGGTAEELIMSSGDDKTGVSEILQAVIENADDRGDSTIRTAAELVRDLDRHGSSLACTVECVSSSELRSGPAESGGEGGGQQSSDGSGSEGDRSPEDSGDRSEDKSGGEQKGKETLTAAVSGYAVISGDGLVGFIDREDAVGVGFLTNELGLSDIIVQDENGASVTLEISRGSTDIGAEWDDKGNLAGLSVKAEVTASIIETEGKSSGDPKAAEEYITAQLEQEVSRRIVSVLRLSKRLGADFLGLGELTEAKYPMKYAKLDAAMSELLPWLELRVSVSGKLDHTNDIKDY